MPELEIELEKVAAPQVEEFPQFDDREEVI